MPRENTLGGRDGTKIGRDERQSKKIARYPRNAGHIASVNCGARRQLTTVPIVFAVSLSRVIFASLPAYGPEADVAARSNLDTLEEDESF